MFLSLLKCLHYSKKERSQDYDSHAVIVIKTVLDYSVTLFIRFDIFFSIELNDIDKSLNIKHNFLS